MFVKRIEVEGVTSKSSGVMLMMRDSLVRSRGLNKNERVYLLEKESYVGLSVKLVCFFFPLLKTMFHIEFFHIHMC
jgi:hypothetical protein